MSFVFPQMSNSFPASSCPDDLLQPDSILEDSQQPPISSAHEIMEIQKIQKSLMSDIENQAAPTVTGTGPLPPYSTVRVFSTVCVLCSLYICSKFHSPLMCLYEDDVTCGYTLSLYEA